ncbi:nuclear factor NF-kappa-B p100 subunit-like [Pollicipes pollicipes]|uniref:nuclear factor NF-kappa-B p100 subunit-like n=1 Tax=Pollicipes pollicipes TaxID=41117 RepID=UPI00188519E1|nr:nuclear factor NF-kappa-B p100 subunit-like [Pollicipes pollicipes]
MHMGGPRLLLLEQPQERFRFRYESELGGTHGQLAGRSGSDRRSFPTVKLEGFRQQAVIRCELFTVEEAGSGGQHVPHVHTLQGRNCSGGMAEMRVGADNEYTASFQGLGIIHTAKKQMVEKIMRRKLDERKRLVERTNLGKLWTPSEVDKMEAQEQATQESQRINMNRVCLRFRALFQNPHTMEYEEICAPVFSDAIYNGKSAQTGELKIVQLSEAYSPCTGNKEIWLLVERVRKNDIKVRVYEENEEHCEIWCDYGRVIKCHHQYAIIFQTPPYRNKDLPSPVRVFIQLERPSDGCVSEPKNFQYTERDQRTPKRLAVTQDHSDSNKRQAFDVAGGSCAGRSFQFEVPQSERELRETFLQMEQANYSGFQSRVMMEQQQQQQPQQQQPPQQQQHQQQMRNQPQAAPYYLPPSSYQPSMGTEPQLYDATLHQPSYPQPSPPMGAEAQLYDPGLHQQFSQPSPPALLPNRDPRLSSAAPRTSHSVEDVMLDNIPLTVPTLAVPQSSASTTSPRMASHGGFRPMDAPDASVMGVPGEQVMEGVLDGILSGAQLQEFLNALPPGIMDDSCPQPPRRNHAPPRRLRVLGVLVTSLCLRPQLAYTNANSLYLFAATGEENFLLENYRCLVGMENLDGDNVLHVAAMFRRSKAMASLLEAISGVPPELRAAMINSPNADRQSHLVDRAGNTALHLAAQDGADVAAPDDTEGRSPLHMAVEARNPDMCRLLLDRGAAVDALTFADVTPLHIACKLGDRRLVALLISAGADPRRQSVERQIPAGSGTESEEDEAGERETDEAEESAPRLDAFLYAEMAGDSQPRVVRDRDRDYECLTNRRSTVTVTTNV